ANAKVVFSGNDIALEQYNSSVKYSLIDALPDENALYLELENLIRKPYLLERYSKNAYDYVIKNHNINYNINKFIKVWEV
ncbi:hypothetical protein, partial [Acinetobacter nosocomialis]|uniref:hypothetical protein n=1 Tax=Acinetobacter nosocomialis TaxID=106654 RepID=UPI0030F84393